MMSGRKQQKMKNEYSLSWAWCGESMAPIGSVISFFSFWIDLGSLQNTRQFIWLVVQFWPEPSLQIQPHKYPPWPLVKACLKELFVGHFLVRPVLLYYLYPLFVKAGVSRDRPLPSVCHNNNYNRLEEPYCEYLLTFLVACDRGADHVLHRVSGHSFLLGSPHASSSKHL